MIRYYMGKIKLRKISGNDPMKKALYESLEFGLMGSKQMGFKQTYPGELNVIPYRLCWRNKK